MISPSSHPPQKFLGLDLRGFSRDLGAAWTRMQQAPLLAWLSPAVPVRVVDGGAGSATWSVDGFSAQPSARDAGATRFAAVLLPGDLVLLRTLLLPRLSAHELREAVALDVASASPFPPEDVAWGFTVAPEGQGLAKVHVALASSRQIRAHLQSRGLDGATWPPEVWAASDGAGPIVLGGFGEDRRLAFAARQRRIGYTLVGTALLLMAAAALTPVAQLRLRALDAARAHEALARRSEPVLRQRAALVSQLETLDAADKLLALRAEPVAALSLLTNALPEDTYLLTLQMQGRKVNISGLTGNAAALMQRLSSLPDFADVRAPVAAMRSPGNTKDTFNIELTLAPVRSILAGPAADGPGATAAAPAQAAPVAPANSGGASFGGSAVTPAPADRKP